MKLLDQLCSQVDSSRQLEVGREEDEAIHRVTSLAWAAFQVLADRCVSWESQETAVVSSGLAQQVRGFERNNPIVLCKGTWFERSPVWLRGQVVLFQIDNSSQNRSTFYRLLSYCSDEGSCIVAEMFAF